MITSLPLYSSMTAAVLILMQMILMMTVGNQRMKSRQGLGDGGDSTLERKIRRHGNLSENAAIFIVGLALLELIGGNGTAVLVLGSCFIVARILHAVGLSKDDGPNAPRFLGAIGTALISVGMSGYLFYTAIGLLG